MIKYNMTNDILKIITEDEEIAKDLTGANGHARLIPDDEKKEEEAPAEKEEEEQPN